MSRRQTEMLAAIEEGQWSRAFRLANELSAECDQAGVLAKWHVARPLFEVIAALIVAVTTARHLAGDTAAPLPEPAAAPVVPVAPVCVVHGDDGPAPGCGLCTLIAYTRHPSFERARRVALDSAPRAYRLTDEGMRRVLEDCARRALFSIDGPTPERAKLAADVAGNVLRELLPEPRG